MTGREAGSGRPGDSREQHAGREQAVPHRLRADAVNERKMIMATVEISDVRKAYGTQKVIHGVNLSIADGEFVSLIGASGCGKSTLLM
jgi:ABC-type bacteriocin/lantibiotic exporter with double-glycine peptidase domain